jgi:hypothetical protein
VAVPATFIGRVLPATRQTSLSSAREKVLSKEGFVDVLFAEPSLPSVFGALPSASGTRQRAVSGSDVAPRKTGWTGHVVRTVRG